MRIMQNTFAVFWKHNAASRQQFMADVPAATAREAFETFRAMFPDDYVCSVRGASGRFAAYKGA